MFCSPAARSCWSFREQSTERVSGFPVGCRRSGLRAAKDGERCSRRFGVSTNPQNTSKPDHASDLSNAHEMLHRPKKVFPRCLLVTVIVHYVQTSATLIFEILQFSGVADGCTEHKNCLVNALALVSPTLSIIPGKYSRVFVCAIIFFFWGVNLDLVLCGSI